MVLEPLTISDFIQYLPRFLKLVVFSNNTYFLSSVENSLKWVCDELENLSCKSDEEGVSHLASKMVSYINLIIEESKVAGCKFYLKKNSKYNEDGLKYFLADVHFLPLNSVFTTHSYLLEPLLNTDSKQFTKYEVECDDLKKALNYKFEQM